MTAQTHAHVAGILNAYDFSEFKTIADIGGGIGPLLRLVLETNPNAKSVLLDLPHVVEQANRSLGSHHLSQFGEWSRTPDGLENLSRFHSGSFFEEPLPDCDACLMK